MRPSEGAAGPAMRDCPRYTSCSAPICPLDPDWRKRAYSDDERVCFYMTEAAKDGAARRFGRQGLDDLHRAVSEASPAICARWARIARIVAAASLTGSRIDAQQAAAERLRRGGHATE